MIDFALKIDGMDKMSQGLDPEIHENIFTRVVNEVVPTVAVRTLNKVKKEWNLGTRRAKVNGKYTRPQTWLFSRRIDAKTHKRTGIVRFIPASTGGTAIIHVKSAAIPLSIFETNPDYSYKELKKPAKLRKKIKYKLQKKTKVLEQVTPKGYAFRAKMRSGHEGIFFRQRGTKRIYEDHTITPTFMFEKADAGKIAVTVWRERAPRRYMHHLDRLQRGIYR